jgi:hypothetical protein
MNGLDSIYQWVITNWLGGYCITSRIIDDCAKTPLPYIFFAIIIGFVFGKWSKIKWYWFIPLLLVGMLISHFWWRK